MKDDEGLFYQKQSRPFFAYLVYCKSPNRTSEFMSWSLRASQLESRFTRVGFRADEKVTIAVLVLSGLVLRLR